ncbi:AP-4 complex accessory subunit Tepsin-like [Crassostrea virginica]
MTDNKAVNAVFEKVSFVSKISTVLKATSDDDSTVPGHLYTEISNITLESDGYCDSMLEYLVDRLKKQSCHVKLKVMKLMKHILLHGNPQFRLGLLKCSQGITEAKKYNGPPDPLHGNIPYLAVRKTAKELLEILFDTESLPSSRAPIASAGYGPQTIQKSKMEGFGNTVSPQKVGIGKSLLQNISDFAQQLTEDTQNPQTAVLSALEAPGSYKPPVDLTYCPPTDSTGEVHPAITRKEVVHIPGKAGGGWDDDEDDDNDDNVDDSTSSGKHSGSNVDVRCRSESGTYEDWSTEENLVKTTVATGNRPLLTNAQISEFIKSCQMCNCDKVLELLSQSLHSAEGDTLMRSLLLVENFLRTDIYGIEQISEACGKALLKISEGEKSPETSKAKKIIRILEKLRSMTQIESSS